MALQAHCALRHPFQLHSKLATRRILHNVSRLSSCKKFCQHASQRTNRNLSTSVSTSGPGTESAANRTSSQTDSPTVLFDWKKQWYPVAVIEDLPTDRPTAIVILGKDLVVWCDKAEEWHVFEDKCPHRKVPLSEGRVEADGTLSCAYHGWRFEGGGSCTAIPQARSDEQEKQAAGAARACATVYPTRAEDGLLFVWMDAGPNALQESSRKDPEMVMGDSREWRTGSPWYMREMLQSWDIVIENTTDPAHVPFSHHGLTGFQDDKRLTMSAGDRKWGTSKLPGPRLLTLMQDA